MVQCRSWIHKPGKQKPELGPVVRTFEATTSGRAADRGTAQSTEAGQGHAGSGAALGTEGRRPADWAGWQAAGWLSMVQSLCIFRPPGQSRHARCHSQTLQQRNGKGKEEGAPVPWLRHTAAAAARTRAACPAHEYSNCRGMRHTAILATHLCGRAPGRCLPGSTAGPAGAGSPAP
jgi:hypothetical protein